jgi:hypothetical protein
MPHESPLAHSMLMVSKMSRGFGLSGCTAGRFGLYFCGFTERIGLNRVVGELLSDAELYTTFGVRVQVGSTVRRVNLRSGSKRSRVIADNCSEPLASSHSLAPQSNHRINLCRPPRRNPAGQQRDCHQQQGNPGISQRVRSRHAEQHSLH